MNKAKEVLNIINEADVDKIAAEELKLFISNDADLYQQRIQPIEKNLAKKYAKGNFDSDLAVKGFMHLANDGAKKYIKDFGGDKYTFSVPTRKLVATMFAKDFEVEAKLGNFTS